MKTMVNAIAVARRRSMGLSRICVALLLATWMTQSSAADPPLGSRAARVLAARCLECHTGDDPQGQLDLSAQAAVLAGGESGRVLVPGQPLESLLWTRVRDGEMPPEDATPLTGEEREMLRQWIQAGAPYPASGRIDAFQYSTDSRAGYDWWALQPLSDAEVPLPSDDAWGRNPIDAFVARRLAQAGLSPSREAEPRVLVRRLYFDLIGLPPEPATVRSFVEDPSDEAYERIVDQLLRSPHYGERWGRHWLDVARFGESDGFERNNVRENQWYYRDWVIRALNDDLPYPEFARLQIAGDLLQPGRGGLSAVGFLTAGVHNTVVGGSEFMKRTARQDELEEIAGAIGQTFTGLTINCARCHDHKFDPISQREYYRFISAIGGVYHGEREYRDESSVARVKKLQAEVERLATRLNQLELPARARALASRDESRPEPLNLPAARYEWSFDDGCDARDHALPGHAKGLLRIDDGALVVDGESYVETEPLPISIRAKTLTAYVQLDDLDQRGGGVISLQTIDGVVFDAIVFGERSQRRWMAGSNGFVRSQRFEGEEETAATERAVHIAIVYHEDGTIERYRDGQLYGETYRASLQSYEAGKSVVRFGIRHLPVGGNRHLRGRIHHAQLFDRALAASEVAALANAVPNRVTEPELVAQLDPAQRAQRTRWRDALQAVREQLVVAQSQARRKIYTVAARSEPGVARLLRRGNAMDEAGPVTPGAIRAVPGATDDFGLAADASDRERRLALADWVTHEHNPLFARVIANRLWHYHFGVGLVETPNDFGFNGGRPSHPQLLDWLARELGRQRGSLKALHRLIVSSATYRQSSRPRQEALAQDADNRLLWRKSPLRLDAESLRDAMLFVSGTLNTKQFGPGFRDVEVNYHEGTTYYTPIDGEHPEFHRRTVYRFTPRGGRSAILDTFDCPDPANAAPRRTVTTTPLQALALLNNQFVLRIADHFGRRIKRTAREHATQDAVESAFQLAFARSPVDDERQLATRLLETHGPAALARLLFNSNEFVTIE